MTNKQLWRNKGDVDYIRIEARPMRKEKLGVTVELDWLPEGDSGAYAAYVALMKAGLSKKSFEEASRFYKALHEFARQHGGHTDDEKPPTGDSDGTEAESSSSDVGGVAGEHEGSEG